ncbi:MAG: hypothetical protein A2W28_11800, partial [Gammaproteobacteria bacterium RBG_16_51_14]
ETTRVSVNSNETPANGDSFSPTLSADGRYVAFESDATNLVIGDSNGTDDVFIHDRVTGVTTRVSVSGGTQANDASDSPALSADGRYVAFYSDATNLVTGDSNGTGDIFVHDRVTGVTTRVSVSGGTQANDASDSPALSADGRYVAFYSDATNLVTGDTNGTGDIFIHNRETGETTRVSVADDVTEANGYSDSPALSADGRYVAFYSDATNLVTGGASGIGDIFVHDRETAGVTTRVSVASNGTEADSASILPTLSADGRYVAFTSFASNLDPGDTNGMFDIFVHDRVTVETTRVSVASNGTEADFDSFSPTLSADGRYVTFESWASNLVTGDTNDAGDIFIVRTGITPGP